MLHMILIYKNRQKLFLVQVFMCRFLCVGVGALYSLQVDIIKKQILYGICLFGPGTH